MPGDLSREGIALLEHVLDKSSAAGSGIERGLAVVRESAYRLFIGSVHGSRTRHAALSAEDAAALLKISTARADEVLGDLAKVGALVLEGTMYRLPRPTARDMERPVDLSSAGRQLAERAVEKRAVARVQRENDHLSKVVPPSTPPPTVAALALRRTGDLLTAVCKYSQCGVTFSYPSRRGPPPTACSAEHKSLYARERDRRRNAAALSAAQERAHFVPQQESPPAEPPGSSCFAAASETGKKEDLAIQAPDARRQILTLVATLPADEAAALLSELLHQVCTRLLRERRKS